MLVFAFRYDGERVVLALQLLVVEFLQLLQAEKDSLSSASYTKYMEAGTALFEQNHDLYLKSAIMSRYARFLHNPEATGCKVLSLDVVSDMIRYTISL